MIQQAMWLGLESSAAEPMMVRLSSRSWAVVKTLRQASLLVRAEIADLGVGASGWCGKGVGDVTLGDKLVARVSYNGRVWSPAGDEIDVSAKGRA